MGRTLKSQAEYKMLAWSRKSARQSIAAAAKAARVTEARIAAWEDGSDSPSFHQLSLLATLYKRPTCVFYLKEPPPDFTLLKDLRSLPGTKIGDFSPRLALAIRQAKERSVWLSALMRSTGESPLDFVRSCSLKSSSTIVGRKLRRLLGITPVEQFQSGSNAKAFSLWRQRCEELGVCVFSVGRIDTEEMRGFAIVDKYAPVAAINSNDTVVAKTFTLLHEMAHILLGAEGVSDVSFSSNKFSDGITVEKFCNAVAAEALVPETHLLKQFSSYGSNHNIATTKLATYYRVSEEVIARRLLDLGQVTSAFYRRIRAICSKRAADAAKRKEEEPKREIMIPQYKLARSRIGTRFSKAVIAAFHDGEIDGTDVSQLLGMKITHLRNLEAYLFPYRIGDGSKVSW
jgi:Zn-dependent peptidase ImmA (M78 family)/transcriptional regulator with XRE-family HTH domain